MAASYQLRFWVKIEQILSGSLGGEEAHPVSWITKKMKKIRTTRLIETSNTTLKNSSTVITYLLEKSKICSRFLNFIRKITDSFQWNDQIHTHTLAFPIHKVASNLGFWCDLEHSVPQCDIGYWVVRQW